MGCFRDEKDLDFCMLLEFKFFFILQFKTKKKKYVFTLSTIYFCGIRLLVFL